MAALPDGDRQNLWAKYMSDLSARRDLISVTKADLRVALDAVDDWVNINMVSFNLTIPLPTRTALTARQKAELLLLVIRRRFEVS